MLAYIIYNTWHCITSSRDWIQTAARNPQIVIIQQVMISILNKSSAMRQHNFLNEKGWSIENWSVLFLSNGSNQGFNVLSSDRILIDGCISCALKVHDPFNNSRSFFLSGIFRRIFQFIKMTRVRVREDIKILKYSKYQELLDKIESLSQKVTELEAKVDVLSIRVKV